MFERYTEKARRVIFFARFEASHYGSPYIETEHLLLGLLREDHSKAKHLLPELNSAENLRRQIENRITPKARFPTSVEVPLSDESKQVLKFAAGESENWGHRHVGTEHILIGLLQVRASLAAAVPKAEGIDLARVREKLREIKASDYSRGEVQPSVQEQGEKQAAEHFLTLLRQGDWLNVAGFFANAALFVGADGKLWSGQKEIGANLETLLSPFATKNARYHHEWEICRNAELWAGTVLWSSIHLSAQTFPQHIRMTLVFGNDAGEWAIFLLQIAMLAEEKAGKPAAT